jgi:hypothetical protein
MVSSMKKIYVILIVCLLCFPSLVVRSQNAPVTTAAVVTTAIPGNDVILPVTVSGFNNIGTISLTLDYDPAVLTFVSSAHDPLLTDMLVSIESPGRLTAGWFGSTGATLPDGSIIFWVTFHYISGSSALTWFDNGGSCEYSDAEANALNDSPTSHYYINGVVTSQPSPVTHVPSITDAVPGAISIPVTVEGFVDIGTISLTLEYDPLVLTFTGATPNAALSTGFSATSVTGTGGKRNVVIGWFGTGVTLNGGGTATLATLAFTYTTSNGLAFSALTWKDNGNSCEYANSSAEPLYDSPTADYYENGVVAAQLAPITYLPSVINATTGTRWIPVIVDNFTNIASISLTFEYDPDVMTYANEFSSSITGLFANTQNLPNGNKKIVIGRFGDPASLSNGSQLVNLKFNYLTGTTALTFLDNGESCEYTDANYNPLFDQPMAVYYFNGMVTGQLSPVTFAPVITDAAVGNITIPITVNNFNSINAFSLTLDYNPDVISFVSATPNGTLGGVFNSNVSVPGRLEMGWFGDDVKTIATGGTSVTLVFHYYGGTTDLAFYNNGGTCEYSDLNFNPLYDLPTADYYHDGLITGMLAPVTYLPALTGAFPGDLWIPVTVDYFTQISGVSLTFEYDPDVMTYSNVFSSTIPDISVGSQTLPNGNRKIVIGRMGSPVSLTNGSTLISLKFTYISGMTPLTWIDDGVSCEYSDATYYPLYDLPTADFYHNGMVVSQTAPVIVADTSGCISGNLVTVPVWVYGFTNINSFSLTLDYNPDVLTFECATPNIVISESFQASEAVPGRLEMGWFDVEKTLADGIDLVYLTFLYHGGTSALVWYDNGANCQYTSGFMYEPLYDMPTADFYKNGRVVPAPVWTGAVSSEWTLPANWQNSYLPDSFFDVFISSSPSPANWPVFTGNFAVGTQCKSLTISGTAIMQVTGDLTIEPGRTLSMTGTGTIKVGKDWNNYGVFDFGNGTVEFNGATDGNIDSEMYPLVSLSAYSLSTFTKGMTEISGGTAGPTGDNTHSDVPIGFTFNYTGTDYTTLRINTNGWISFNLTGSDVTSGNNSSLFFADAPGAALAPWWDDLKADGSTAISYQSSGGVFTIEWKNILAYSSLSTTRLNFQVKLYSGTNVIEFCYGSAIAGTHNSAEGASIGIKDITGGFGRFIEATTGSKSIANTCLESGSNWPAVNYRFSPPAISGTEHFWKVVISKTAPAKLDIKRDVHVTGL